MRSGFWSQSATRLLCPHSTEDNTPRLMVKQLSIARNTQRDSQSYIEKKREGGKEIEVTRSREERVKRKRTIKPVIKSLSENGY